jgi:hypothetical protein
VINNNKSAVAPTPEVTLGSWFSGRSVSLAG